MEPKNVNAGKGILDAKEFKYVINKCVIWLTIEYLYYQVLMYAERINTKIQTGSSDYSMGQSIPGIWPEAQSALYFFSGSNRNNGNPTTFTEKYNTIPIQKIISTVK